MGPAHGGPGSFLLGRIKFALRQGFAWRQNTCTAASAAGRLRRLDEAAGALVLEDGRRIPLKGVLALDSELFPPGL